MEPVEDYIAHLEAKYDPTKAHEYYMRVRKLKGKSAGHRPEARKPTTGGAAARAKKVESKKVVHLRKKAAQESAQIQKKLEAFLKQMDLNPGTDPEKVKQFQIRNHRQGASQQLKKISGDLKNAVASAQAHYKRELKKLRTKR